jgi:hypothetical protein
VASPETIESVIIEACERGRATDDLATVLEQFSSTDARGRRTKRARVIRGLRRLIDKLRT